MPSLAQRYDQVRDSLDKAARAAGRAPESVTLIAVSKRHPAEAIAACHALGQRDFGESYLQEALAKQAALAELPLIWHFIGPMQSNKTRAIAESFSWVHSVDRLKIARRLSEQRPVELPELQICLQVNVSGEASKSGLTLTELPQVAPQVAALPRLRLRGLMAIPAPADDPARQREPFQQLRAALERLNEQGLELDTLSMGMSNDMRAAILEGSTQVRVGSALFGPRTT